MSPKITDIRKNTVEAVFRNTDEERFCQINNEYPVDHRNNIQTENKGQRKCEIIFPVKKNSG
jgi:hypothetical protein